MEREVGMKALIMILITGLLFFVALTACTGAKRIYKKGMSLEKTIEFRPKQLATGGDVTDHPCIRGSYIHVYDTDQGQYGQREVWLCCVPVDEILSDSFDCGCSSFPTISMAGLLGGDSDYWKIRSCYLLHPTETEPTFIPVCIPAPLQVETSDEIIK